MITKWILRIGVFAIAANFVVVLAATWAMTFGYLIVSTDSEVGGFGLSVLISAFSFLWVCSCYSEISKVIDL